MIKNDKTKAVIFMILASILFTTMNLLGKLSIGISIHQKAFFSNITALIIVSIVIIKNKISFFGSKETRLYLIIRGVCGALSLAGLYYTLDNMILSDSTLLSKLGPFFATIFGLIIFKDKISKKQVLLLLLTLIGAILVIKPSISFAIIPALIGLISAACAGLAFSMIRLIGKKENKFTIIFYNLFTISLVSFPFIFLHTENYKKTPSIIFSILSGLCIAFGQYFLTQAYKLSPAANIAMYDYTGLLLSAVYGFFLFKEYPDIYSIIGYILILSVSIINYFVIRDKE